VYLGTNIIIHNDFAEILMGCGIIGFTVYLFILLRVFRLLIHSLKKTKKPQIARAVILALSSFFVFVSFHMTNITSGVLVLSMWAIFNGATIGVAQASSKSDNEPSVHIL
jgi:O-antigen ligase